MLKTLEDVLLEELEYKPQDSAVLAVLGDRCLEKGKELDAEAWRYFRVRGKYPEKALPIFWWLSILYHKRPNNQKHTLPFVWHTQIEMLRANRSVTGGSVSFRSNVLAFQDAVKTYTQLTDDQRQEVWREGNDTR